MFDDPAGKKSLRKDKVINKIPKTAWTRGTYYVHNLYHEGVVCCGRRGTG